jgi:DNA-binding GntR family transcriptional regulator
LAVDHFSNADLRELRTIFNNLGDYRNVEKVSHNDFAVANVTFHRSILEHSNNPNLIGTVKSLYDHLNLIRLKTIEMTDRRARSLEEHEAIMQALEARKADQAEKAMRAHIQALKIDIEKKLEKNPDFFPHSG